jgi:hypothetical protein
MADPVSALAIGSAIAGLAGGGMSAAGAYGSSKAASANANYQAQVAANNATIARQNAGMDTQAGEIAATNQGMKTRAAVGSIQATQGASGIDVNSGSAPKVRAAASELGLMDALTIRSTAAKKAYADTVAATGDTAEAGLLQSEAAQASAAAPIGALGSFLSSASSVGGTYARYQFAGGSGSAT